MTDKKLEIKYGGNGPTKTKGTNLSGRWTDSEYQAFCRDILNQFNRGKKRKMSSYMLIEIMGIISDKLLDREIGWALMQTLLHQAKTRRERKYGKNK